MFKFFAQNNAPAFCFGNTTAYLPHIPCFYPKLFLSRECSRFMCFKAELQIHFFSRAVNTRMFSNSFLLRWSWLTSQGHQFPTIFFQAEKQKIPFSCTLSSLLALAVWLATLVSCLLWAWVIPFPLLPSASPWGCERIWGEGCGVPASVGRAVVSTEVLCGCWQMAQYDWLK